jgi:hypothetical protein
LTARSLNRWLERIHRPKAVSLVACAAALIAALAGCQSQQTNSGDPFLPFMRTRVPPPGTNVPADSYYQGAPATSAPPASMPPPAGAPMTTPSSMRSTAPADKYGPPGGYNLPQSSIDRSKVIDPATGELKAGGTAIARRSLAKPTRGQSIVDTQLTAGKVTTTNPEATAVAAAAAGAATVGAQEMPAADSLTTAGSDHDPGESSAEDETSTEMGEAQMGPPTRLPKTTVRATRPTGICRSPVDIGGRRDTPRQKKIWLRTTARSESLAARIIWLPTSIPTIGMLTRKTPVRDLPATLR